MAFAYKNVAVSGSRSDTEGSSKTIQEIKSVMVNQMGWVVHDDRTTAAGNAHKLVLRSNGEGDDKPTFYMIMTSGINSSSTAGSNGVTFQMSSYWDAASHTLGSGVATYSGLNATNNHFLVVQAENDNLLWISGDKDAVHVASNYWALNATSHTLGTVSMGRCYNFLPVSQEPYGLFVRSTTGTAVLGAGAIQLVAGNNPMLDVLGITTNYTMAATNQPSTFTDPGTFLFTPLLALIADVTPTRKGAVGLLPGVWDGMGSGVIGLQNFSTVTSSGTFGTRTYIAFIAGTTESIIFRMS